TGSPGEVQSRSYFQRRHDDAEADNNQDCISGRRKRRYGYRRIKYRYSVRRGTRFSIAVRMEVEEVARASISPKWQRYGAMRNLCAFSVPVSFRHRSRKVFTLN